MPFVYILENKKGEFYVGSTADLDARLKQHLNGYTVTTKRMQAFNLVLSQEYKSIKDAKKVEYKIKRLKRHDYIASIVKDGFIKIKP